MPRAARGSSVRTQSMPVRQKSPMQQDFQPLLAGVHASPGLQRDMASTGSMYCFETAGAPQSAFSRQQAHQRMLQTLPCPDMSGLAPGILPLGTWEVRPRLYTLCWHAHALTCAVVTPWFDAHIAFAWQDLLFCPGQAAKAHLSLLLSLASHQGEQAVEASTGSWPDHTQGLLHFFCYSATCQLLQTRPSLKQWAPPAGNTHAAAAQGLCAPEPLPAAAAQPDGAACPAAAAGCSRRHGCTGSACATTAAGHGPSHSLDN